MSGQPSAWVRQWVKDFVSVEEQVPQVEAWVARTAASIMSAIPELASRHDLVGEIDRGIREHWIAFLRELDRAEMHFELVPSAQRIAHQAAETSLPLETLGRVYRVAQRSTWSYVTSLMSDVHGSETDRTELIIFLWERAAQWIDSSVDESVRIYQDARQRNEIGTNALRYEVVSQLLQGDLSDAARASADLGGYAIRSFNTALILSSQEHYDYAIDALEEIGRDLARQVQAKHPLVVRPGGRRVWVWLATQHEPAAPLRSDLVGSLDERARIAVGPSRRGISGFVESHHLAQRVAEVTSGHGHGVLNFRELELVVLLGCSRDVDMFVRRTLGNLADPSAHAQRLRDTVTSFIRQGTSIDAAAQELVVHRNTVRYRLQQATKLLRDDLIPSSPEVSLALRHFEVCHHSDSADLQA
ncbi:MAG: helix-turn-helix domain-containing protein [Nocardioides sp.]|uniref:PucR family transcriptional regulator n=1 Tax=Nocardioides sp. TaxID=35761 RepID=UPI002B279010|nr:helix-turn-helix domain-containing protein [Nocardioides sp.]